MFEVQDIHPLTEFLRQHKAYLERLQSTGRPELLTVNGRAKVVVQDADAYQTMLEALDTYESAKVIQSRLESLRNGEPGVPAETVLKEIREVLGIDSTEHP